MMRSFGRFLGRLLAGLVLLGAALWAFAPRDTVDMQGFQAVLPDDLDLYLARTEADVAGLTPGTAKEIIWNGEKGAKTPWSVIYLHGFSATSHEIRPVPEKVAATLGANLFFTRLSGHGQGPAAMAAPSAGDWIRDTGEALAIARRLGDRVLILSTSTGGTLAAIAALNPEMKTDIGGIVFISPNFGLAFDGAFILDMPLARYWGPWIAGPEIAWQPRNVLQEEFWETRYPTTALFPLAALIRFARAQDYSQTTIPALFYYNEADPVVDASRIEAVATAWAAPKKIVHPDLRPQDDPHLIAGAITAPDQVAPAVALILDWAKGL